MLKIVSGGQTGADRAALDAAIEANISYGGWCPKGRIDENGPIPAKYSALVEVAGTFENDTQNYATRTKLNIKDSCGTLILAPKIPLPKEISDGTLLTITAVNQQKKPFLIIDLSLAQQLNISSIVSWLATNDIKTLNIAGPRESSSPGVYRLSLLLLRNLLNKLLMPT